MVSNALSQSGQTIENGTYEGKNAIQAVKDMALDNLIRDVVIEQKALSTDIVIDDNARKMIDQQMQSYFQQAGGKEQFEVQLKSKGVTLSDVTKNVERRYYTYAMYQKFSADTNNQPTADALKEFFTANLIRARHILLKTTDDKGQSLSDDAKKKVREKAEALLKQLQGGADFVKLMNENSEDPGSKSQPDGYIFGKGDMVKEFETAAFALKEGELSGIVETQFGYHIIKREKAMEKYDTYIADAQNKDSISSRIMSGAFEAEIKTWVAAAKTTIVKNEFDAIVVK